MSRWGWVRSLPRSDSPSHDTQSCGEVIVLGVTGWCDDGGLWSRTRIGWVTVGSAGRWCRRGGRVGCEGGGGSRVRGLLGRLLRCSRVGLIGGLCMRRMAGGISVGRSAPKSKRPAARRPAGSRGFIPSHPILLPIPTCPDRVSRGWCVWRNPLFCRHSHVLVFWSGLCKAGVVGSNPIASTTRNPCNSGGFGICGHKQNSAGLAIPSFSSHPYPSDGYREAVWPAQ